MGLIDALATGEIVDVARRDLVAEGVVVTRVQDVEPYLRRNRQLAADGDGYSPSREFRRAATIPNIVVEQWLKQGINVFDENDWPKVAAMLDSPEYAHLRTAPGRLSRRPNRTYFTKEGRRRSTAEQLQQVERGF